MQGLIRSKDWEVRVGIHGKGTFSQNWAIGSEQRVQTEDNACSHE